MRPAARKRAAVAWAKVLVCASLNCLHIVALASSSGMASIQPRRRPGASTLLRLPQCTSSARLPGTGADRLSKLGGGGGGIWVGLPQCTSSARLPGTVADRLSRLGGGGALKYSSP